MKQLRDIVIVMMLAWGAMNAQAQTTMVAVPASEETCEWWREYYDALYWFCDCKYHSKTFEFPLDEVISVAELATGDFAGDTVWVRGFIVGGLASDGTVDFGCEGDVMATVVILADAADCDDPDDCMALQLTKKAHKEALAVSEKAIRDKILHQEIYVQGKATTYKKLPALTNLCAYQLE